MASGTSAAAFSSTVTGNRSCSGVRLKVLADDVAVFATAGALADAAVPGSEQAARPSRAVAASVTVSPDVRVFLDIVLPLEGSDVMLVPATIRAGRKRVKAP
jgi:hypothetical protein